MVASIPWGCRKSRWWNDENIGDNACVCVFFVLSFGTSELFWKWTKTNRHGFRDKVLTIATAMQAASLSRLAHTICSTLCLVVWEWCIIVRDPRRRVRPKYCWVSSSRSTALTDTQIAPLRQGCFRLLAASLNHCWTIVQNRTSIVERFVAFPLSKAPLCASDMPLKSALTTILCLARLHTQPPEWMEFRVECNRLCFDGARFIIVHLAVILEDFPEDDSICSSFTCHAEIVWAVVALAAKIEILKHNWRQRLKVSEVQNKMSEIGDVHRDAANTARERRQRCAVLSAQEREICTAVW